MAAAEPAALRADARANRLRVIEAARALFRERGLDAEMREIAERAGVGFGTVYRNFPAKDELVAAVAAEMIERMRATIEAAGAEDDPLAAIERFVRGGLATVEEYGDLMEILHHGMPPACKEQFAELNPMQHLAAFVRRGVESGALRADLDAGVVATRIIASFIPGLYNWLRADRSPEQIADGVLSVLFDGIRRR